MMKTDSYDLVIINNNDLISTEYTNLESPKVPTRANMQRETTLEDEEHFFYYKSCLRTKKPHDIVKDIHLSLRI